MIGLVFLLVLAIYVGAAWFIVKALSSKKAKYTVIAIFVLIPTWDIVPGWLYLQYLCKTEGGVKVYKSVEGVEGFFDKSQNMLGRDAVMEYGYKFMEGEEGAQLYRYSVGLNGQLLQEKIDEPTSKYGVQSSDHQLPFNITKHQYTIVDLPTQEKLAMSIAFYRAGNWVQNIAKPLLGGGAYCPSQHITLIYKLFYLETLKPAKSPK